MSKLEEILSHLLNPEVSPVVFPATVKSVSGNTCTVTAYENEMEIDDIRLSANIDSNEAIRLIPRIGSLVLVAAIDGDMSNGCVIQYSELDAIEIALSGVAVKVDRDGAEVSKGSAAATVRESEVVLSQDAAKVSISGGKVSISAGGVDLKGWLDDLVQCLNTFTVATSTGPALPAPNSIAQLAQLTTQINLLLS